MSRPLCFRATVQALNSGQRLTFGPLAIDREGLYIDPTSLPWAEVEAVTIQNGSSTIKSVAAWMVATMTAHATTSVIGLRAN